MPNPKDTPRADKRYSHKPMRKTGHAVHTLCGCFIPWVTDSGHSAATFEPDVIALKKPCPKCIELKELDNAFNEAIENGTATFKAYDPLDY